MTLTALSGKTYTAEQGLSSISSDWLVVGRVSMPVVLDKLLGWRNPYDQNPVDFPTFYTVDGYLVVGATYSVTSSTWIANSEDCFFVPSFGVEQLLETGNSRVPTFVRGNVFISPYEIGEDEIDLKVLSIESSLTRIDSSLGWRSPLKSEKPAFVSSSTAIAVGATYTTGWTGAGSSAIFSAPAFSFKKVYEWEEA